MNEELELIPQDEELEEASSTNTSIQLEELLKERDNLKNLVEEQQKEINERKLRAQFKDTVENDLKALYIKPTEDMLNAVEACVSFQDNKAFESTYKAIVKLMCEIKYNPGLTHYIPKGDSSFAYSKQEAINQAFKPPKID